jgi:transposase
METYDGIDVAKNKLDVHVRPGGEAFCVARDAKGLVELVQRLQALPVPMLIVLEATGGFERTVAAALTAAKLPLAVVNPRQIRDFARAVGRLAKTDAIDAAIIAHFAEALRIEPRPIRDDDAIRSSPVWREKEELMVSVPGVAQKTARSLITELPELGSLDRRRTASLVGVAPMNRDSGAMRGKRRITGGRATVRSALYMAAVAAVPRNTPLRDTYQRLRAAGKPAKLGIIAVMRKLVATLDAIIRDKTPWKTA